MDAVISNTFSTPDKRESPTAVEMASLLVKSGDSVFNAEGEKACREQYHIKRTKCENDWELLKPGLSGTL